MKIGDAVKVLGQDIVGIVVRIHKDTNEIVIEDAFFEESYSENIRKCSSPDNQLVYRPDELEVVEEANKNECYYNDYGLDEWDIK